VNAFSFLPTTGNADARHSRLPATSLEPRLRRQLAVARQRGDRLAVATLETALASFDCPCTICHGPEADAARRAPGFCAGCYLNHRPIAGRAA